MDMQAGVYRITDTASGETYIGQAADIPKRWQAHLYALRAGEHHNPRLQAAWSRDGEQAFIWEVIETVSDTATLAARERHHIRACALVIGNLCLNGTFAPSARSAELSSLALRAPTRQAVMSLSRAAMYYHVSYATLRMWSDKGLLGEKRYAKGKIMIEVAALERHLALND